MLDEKCFIKVHLMFNNMYVSDLSFDIDKSIYTLVLKSITFTNDEKNAMKTNLNMCSIYIDAIYKALRIKVIHKEVK